MKKNILVFLLLFCIKVFSQNPAPPLINYQGVARNVAGLPITGQNIGIFFEFLQGSPTGSVSYSEPHTVGTNSLGLFATQIGKTNSLIGFNWQNGPYFLKISIDPTGGSSYTFLGIQQLVSVPYALYAEKAGNGALPTATLNGTTLRYNSGNSNWVIDTNIVNNGNRVWVGNRLNIQRNKFQSITINNNDSSAIFGLHTAAQANYAGVRGIANGGSAPSGTNTGVGIFGGHFIGYNSSGTGMGVLGQGFSASSNGIGLMGIGSSSGTATNNNYAIGVYGTIDANSTAANKFAGIFTKGNVFMSDTLQLPMNGNGFPGDVLTYWNSGKARWQTPSSGLWQFNNNTTSLLNSNSFVGIGTNAAPTKLFLSGNNASISLFPNSASPETAIKIQNDNTQDGNFSSLIFSTKDLGNANYESAKIVGVNTDHTSAASKGELVFMTRDPANINEVLRITSEGHLKASALSINNICTASSNTAVTVTALKTSASNDIRGDVVIVFTPSVNIGPNTQFTITVPFDKAYQTTAPFVQIQGTHLYTSYMSNFIISSSTMGFTVVFRNNTTATIPNATGFGFRYFVIE